MAKLQRYDSQAPIPVEKPVFTRSMQYSQGISQGLGNLAQGIQNFAQNRQRQIEADRMVQEKYQAHLDSRNANLAKDAININAIELQGIYDSENDVTKWEALSKRKLNELRNRINPLLENVSEEQRQFIEDNVNYYEESEMAKMRSLRLKTVARQNLIASSSTYEQFVSNGDIQSAEAVRNAMMTNYNEWFGTEVEANLYLDKLKTSGEQKFHENQVEYIRGLSQASVGEDGDKTAGYAIIEQAQKDGIITAKDNAMLGNSLDDFVAGRLRRASENIYENTLNEYSDFTDKISNGELTFESIAKSQMLKEDKSKWETYIRGQHSKEPRRNLPDGYKSVIGAINAFSLNEVSKKEALDVLMSARYVDKSVNNEVVEWAKYRLENPYPKQFVPVLRGILEDNENGHREFLLPKTKDLIKAQNVNSMLINWVDNQLKEGKEPTDAEMYAQSGVFRRIASTRYVIGDIEERGGKRYEVVGFFADGEPGFEEIK